MMNQLKTIMLLGGLTGIIIWIGSFWGTSGMAIALVFAIIMNFGSYFWSDKIVLAMYKAKPADRREYRKLYEIVEIVAQRANIPMPRIFVLPSANPNAFATGRNPKHGVIAVTGGIMDILTDEELKGVIAHEISHIKNRDILISSVAATLAGVISMIASMAQWAAIFGGFGGRDDGDGGSGIIEFLVLVILTPILATLIQLAISRSREYKADKSAAKILGHGHGLASALKKLEHTGKQRPMRQGNPSTAHMFIMNPFKGGLTSLFTTHPSTKQRVSRLEKMVF